MPGFKEIIEDLIRIGCAKQRPDRKPHLLCIKCCQNIAEISRGYSHVDLLIALYRTVLKELCISIDIVNDLRDEPPNIDGIGGGKLVSCRGKFLCHGFVVKHLFHSGLCLIKVSADRGDKDIVPHLRHHLFFLDRAHTVLRVKDDDLRARHIRKAGQCSLSGVSGCCGKDHDLIFDLIFLCGRDHEMRQNR